MNELIKHIKSLNDETRAWVAEDPENRWAGLYVEEADFWAERGITTVEEFEFDSMASTIYDLYKDVHGIRPRWINFDEMSYEELDSMYKSLLDELDAQSSYEEYLAEIEKEAERTDNMLRSESYPYEQFDPDYPVKEETVI